MIRVTAKQVITYTYSLSVDTVKDACKVTNKVAIDHDTIGLDYPPEIIHWGNPEIIKIEQVEDENA